MLHPSMRSLLLASRHHTPQSYPGSLVSRAVWLCVLVANIALCGRTATAQPCGVREIDSIWEVSTRHLPQCYNGDCNVLFATSRYAEGCWNPVYEGELFSEAEAFPARTVIYIHGNWFPLNDARERAMQVYRLIVARSAEPIRFIVLSWPSQQQERPARDVISKKPLLTATTFYLSSLINRLPAQEIGMLGYSFGGAIAIGAAHLQAGGMLDGWCLQSSTAPHTFRISLLAPAFDKDALNPRGKYGHAPELTQHIVNLYNSRDPILRRYRFFDRSNDPVAAGFAGLSVTYALRPLADNDKVEQFDCRAVGRSHDELDYFECNCFCNAVDNLLGSGGPTSLAGNIR